MRNPRPGIRTTEFWLAVFTAFFGLIGVIPLPAWAYPVIYGCYAIARGLAKVGTIRGTIGEALMRLPERPPEKKL